MAATGRVKEAKGAMEAMGGAAMESSSTTSPHRMRISSGGSMAAYVRFAVTFLEDHPDRSLVLHTVPPDPIDIATKTTKLKGKANAGTTNENATTTTLADGTAPPMPAPIQSPATSSTLHAATLAAPRLVSVVELVKREYAARAHNGSPGSSKRRGIWQYTETGLIKVTEQEAPTLARVLGGKTRPYLQITLATRQLDLELARNVTCQFVPVRRRRRRGANAAKEEEGDVVVPNLARLARVPNDASISRVQDTGRRESRPVGLKRKSIDIETASKRQRTATVP